ncbi:Unknown protein sequence [Pseudomonas amygdali pv. myricae]|nr:Unknown protein sequence [Pseudomonas amygdali pv. myricae]
MCDAERHEMHSHAVNDYIRENTPCKTHPGCSANPPPNCVR